MMPNQLSNLNKYLSLLTQVIFIFTIPVSVLSQPSRTANTTHQGVFNGTAMTYTATVQERILYQENKPVASIITTSYVRDHVENPGRRPVLFVFNGGPGSASSPLHMHALGPKRIVFNNEKTNTQIIDNKYSLLDFIDLVFIDPVGTGYTTLIDTIAAGKYWDVNEDARLIAEEIKTWKSDHGRDSTTVFICGESYGTTRLAAMLGMAKDLPLAGIIMLDVFVDRGAVTHVTGNDLPYVLYLPSMAAVAWFHGKAKDRNQTVEEMFRNAIRFARTDYLTALFQGDNLSANDKDRIASRLSELIGLPKKKILEKNLRLSASYFELTLLAPEGKRVGQLNGQITGPLNAPAVRPPYDDPSMTSGTPSKPMIDKYFREELEFSASGEYITLNLMVNSSWTWPKQEEWPGYWTVAPYVAEALKERPGMNLFVGGGYFDLATPLYAGKYTLEHAGVPTDRVTYADFATGHSIFEREEGLMELTQKLRAFIVGGK